MMDAEFFSFVFRRLAIVNVHCREAYGFKQISSKQEGMRRQNLPVKKIHDRMSMLRMMSALALS